MAEASIPVDLFNPGQVFACLGFLEAADVLCGDAEGGFDWSDEVDVRFHLQAISEENPFAEVLNFLSKVDLKAVAPEDWRPKKEPEKDNDKKKLKEELRKQEKSEVFPDTSPETSSAMPVQFTGRDGKRTVLGHWADGSSRNEFKLYSGNRSALDIATAMLSGTCDKPTKKQKEKGQDGHLTSKGIAQLWEEQQNDLIERPFDVTPMGGSFNFDPRGAWTAIDAGYSPNDQKHQVAASPVVEILAAWGLENARPDEFETRNVRYGAWGLTLPPILARVALFGGIAVVPIKRFRFKLDLSGKNKVVTFAEQETTHD